MYKNYNDLFKEYHQMPYLCDGKKECSVKEGCYINGGDCYHTFDVAHAKIEDKTINF